VQAAPGDAAAAGVAQRGVGGRAAVAGDHLEGAAFAKAELELVEQVEELRVDAADLARVVVAQRRRLKAARLSGR
jgi:hypothetical protein